MQNTILQKSFYLCLLLAFLSNNTFSQTTLFSENLGTPTGTTTIVNYLNGTAPATFQNKGILTYTNGAITPPADVRITSVSSTYPGFSAGGNVFFSATSGSYGFAIETINAAGYNNLILQYGYRKESAAAQASFSVEFWDGTAWNILANTAATLFNEATNAPTGWYLAKPLVLPPAAQINGLKIRFVKSAALSIRIDDIKLTGQISTPTTSTISPSSANVGDPAFTLTVNGTNFLSGNSTVTWNSASRTTTFVSATQLTATIPSTDLSTAGTAIVGVTTAGAAAESNTQNFTINTAAGGTFNLTTQLADFGNVCINTTAATDSFIFDGNNLDGSAINVAAIDGYTFAENSGGPFTSTLTFSYTGSSFTNKIIYVQFSPTAVQSYNGSITVNGGGITNYPINAIGTGINEAPSVTTNGSNTVKATTATIQGSISSIGCATVTQYGFEYSTTTGFINGTGTQVFSNNLNSGNFTATLSGLTPNTRYYYKAFATNSIGTTYGNQQAFTNTALPVPMAAQPSLSYTEDFTDIANWSNFFINGIGANRFTGLGATGAGGIPNGTTLTSSTFSFQNVNLGPPVTPSSSGGVHRGTDQVPNTQSIVLLSTGSPDNTTSAALDFYMDFTGVNAGSLSFDYAEVNNSTGNRNGSLRVYATVDGINFTEISFASVLDFTNNVALSGTKSNIALPAIFNNSATARLRFYYHNGSGNLGTGSRPKISIDNLTVTAVATTPCDTPTAPATSLIFNTITDTTIAASFTASTPATDSYLIVMSTNSSLTGSPINGQTYALGDNLGDGTVIAKGVGTNFTAKGLTALTTYYFFVFPMNAICTGGPLYYNTDVLTNNASTIAGLPPCVAPANQPTNLNFTVVTTNSITGKFTSTVADEYLVIRSTASSLSTNPIDAQTYNVGDVIGNGIVVDRNTDTTFTANGLAPNTNYYFFVFGINSKQCINGPVYNINMPLTSMEATIPLPPCTTPQSQPINIIFTAANTSISANFNAVANADDYLIIKSISPTLSATPIDNVDYAIGENFGGGTVIANSGNNTFLATMLSPNTNYYFFVFAANKICSGGTKYATQSPLTGNVSTSDTPTNNYYFGNLHAHSDYSDGNQDNPGFTPANDYNYAMVSQCMDFLGISEHNHFSSLDNPGNTVSNYHLGITQANDFNNQHSNFLALYGMEWGVISGGGHVLVYGNEQNDLYGWETGSGNWGPSDNYDVFVPRSVYTGSQGLFKTINDNAAKNTFATLAHPNLGDYNNLINMPYDVVADDAIVGTAVESGPAFSTSTTYSNPAASLSYLFYYQLMLAKGYHLGPTIDHDNHNTTFGRATYSRTAVVSPSLSKTDVISAIKNMHFYATQDCDTKVDFTINTKIIGSSIVDKFAPNISVILTDATTTFTSAIIRLMHGVPGSGNIAVKIDSAIGSNMQFTDNNLPNLATGYYYIDITNGTSRIITSPIWYTRNDNITVVPVKISRFDVQKNGKTTQLNWITDQEINSSYFVIERSSNGINFTPINRINAAGNSSTQKQYIAYDNAPLNGSNYYRLKQVDIDGKFIYSTIKMVNFTITNTYSISPNPATDYINIYKANNKNVSIQITDVLGKTVKNIQANNQIIKISLLGFSKGIYFIKIKDGFNLETQKFIVE